MPAAGLLWALMAAPWPTAPRPVVPWAVTLRLVVLRLLMTAGLGRRGWLGGGQWGGNFPALWLRLVAYFPAAQLPATCPWVSGRALGFVPPGSLMDSTPGQRA